MKLKQVSMYKPSDKVDLNELNKAIPGKLIVASGLGSSNFRICVNDLLEHLRQIDECFWMQGTNPKTFQPDFMFRIEGVIAPKPFDDNKPIHWEVIDALTGKSGIVKAIHSFEKTYNFRIEGPNRIIDFENYKLALL